MKTNAYGTAAGRVRRSRRDASSAAGRSGRRSAAGGRVRVEEYKRPTFEVTLKEPAEALRLNRPATLRGEARYYFGLPVANGRVRWRVTREPVWPWWGWWWRSAPTWSGADGGGRDRRPSARTASFEMTFTPKADERRAGGPGANPEVTWRYAVRADVTDDGGETRSADRRFRLGFVAVEARIERSTNFFLEGKTASVSIVRTDLDGAPRAGKGIWRLIRLVPPEKTLLPADFPSKNPETTSAVPRPAMPTTRDAPSRRFRTPGDLLRPRWETRFSAEEWMRDWPEGAEVASGAVEHDAKGEARIDLGKLRAGAYRLRLRDGGRVSAAGSPFRTTSSSSRLRPRSRCRRSSSPSRRR